MYEKAKGLQWPERFFQSTVGGLAQAGFTAGHTEELKDTRGAAESQQSGEQGESGNGPMPAPSTEFQPR